MFGVHGRVRTILTQKPCRRWVLVGGCTDPEADNFDEEANVDDGLCESLAAHPSRITMSEPEDDGSCVFSGCTQEEQ